MTAKEKTVLERMEQKVCEIHDYLFDPDDGLYARVRENTRWRKNGQWFLNILLSGIFLGIIGILFFIIRGGLHG